MTDLLPLEVWKELLACDVLCTNEKTSELYVTIVSISHDVLNDRPRMYCRVFLSCFIVHILVLMSEDAGSAGETLQNIGTILNCYSNDNKKVVRRIESLEKKRINHLYAVLFNEQCIKENLLPNFTNVKTYDRAVQQGDLTAKYRKDLLEEETKRKKEQLEDIECQLVEANDSLSNLPISEELKKQTRTKLNELKEIHEETVRTRVVKKLSSLYGSTVPVKNSRDCFVNLSSHVLTKDQKDLLNLGLKCKLYPKVNQEEKKAELEILYQQICEKHKTGKIQVNPDIKAQLLSEGTKRRGSTRSHLISSRLRKAAIELKNSRDLIIRRADKSDVFVLLDRSEYLSKVKAILDDAAKFERLTRNPIEKQKKTSMQSSTLLMRRSVA